MSSLIYLCSPYSDPDPAVRQERFEAVCRAAAGLMVRGLVVFSPIAHTHHIALAGNLPTGWDYWQKVDAAFLSACSRVVVLMLPGWRDSKGIAEELRLARVMGKPFDYLTPE